MEEKNKISEEKAKKLIVAGTVGAVLLVLILLFVMVYQLISIGVYNKRIKNYEMQISEYNRMIEEGASAKETYQMEWWIRREALALGLVVPENLDDN